MKIQKFHGTSITINGKKHKLSDLDYEQFLLNDKTDDVGYYVNLSSYFGDSDGINRIIVDIPGGSRPSWEFVYIHNFNAKFDEAPYVFEPRGTVTFPEHINIKEIEEFCDKEPNNNSYKFIIKEINRTLDFVMDINGIDVNISIDVPALFIKNSNGEWDSNRPAPIWYKDLDVHKDGQLIADKIPFINGNAIVQWDITSGIYSIEVFELENDDSGFDSSEYYSIGVYDQELLNPYDMTELLSDYPDITYDYKSFWRTKLISGIHKE